MRQLWRWMDTKISVGLAGSWVAGSLGLLRYLYKILKRNKNNNENKNKNERQEQEVSLQSTSWLDSNPYTSRDNFISFSWVYIKTPITLSFIQSYSIILRLCWIHPDVVSPSTYILTRRPNRVLAYRHDDAQRDTNALSMDFWISSCDFR